MQRNSKTHGGSEQMQEIPQSEKKILVGVSSCLLGERVRFDSGHKHSSFLTKQLSAYFEYRPFCPEMAIGLGVPREPIRLISSKDKPHEIRCVGTKDASRDFTDQLRNSADQQRDWQQDLCGYVLKKGSPSCGMERVKVYTNGMPNGSDSGIYAKRLMENFPDLPIEEEGRLNDAAIRENFISRVIIYRRLRDLQSDNSLHKLLQFHARHKLILMSHNQQKARAIGKQLSIVRADELNDFMPVYISAVMETLAIIATKRNHVNVLQHIQGYLKRDIDQQDKQELCEATDQYRLGKLPLIVPVSLLRHHFRKHPNRWINDSYYLDPHPRDLMLLNAL